MLASPRLSPAVDLHVTGGDTAAALESAWHLAWSDVGACVRPLGDSLPVLTEGGPYPGAWLESTASVSTEVLAMFAPEVARDTHLLLAHGARDDGLLPYKVTADGPAFFQVQRVTPLARAVHETYQRLARAEGAARVEGAAGTAGAAPGAPAVGPPSARDYLRTMYDALARDDAWIAAHRDTRGTGGTEAFCTYDTGHDASPRFWHVPDTTPGGDPARWDTGNPRLPFVAPDLTAHTAGQRTYLALLAAELGEDPGPWRAAAHRSLAALATLRSDDGAWYDLDATGSPVRIVSDVLLRVLACEAATHEEAHEVLARYLLSTRKLHPAVPFASLALDDPRFDHDAGQNSWGGPTNLLSLIRAPRAFEEYGHVAELAGALRPAVVALARAQRFPQTLDPWTGAPGYTEQYSPAALFYLDAVERLCGIHEDPDGTLWFSGVSPVAPGREPGVSSVTYARETAPSGSRVRYEQVLTLAPDGTGGVRVRRDGEPWLAFPAGWRVAVAPSGAVTVTGLHPAPVTGELTLPDDGGARLSLTVAGNEVVTLGPGPVIAHRGGPAVIPLTT
ncbi:MGH1-like glycoside hydrolase domain-containing protein [Antribacter gilvus]|uniref:MGH1-like glycoside hydrolase domain-containing protein n=1 Tax=Antribacter gilvus TaxID=2304675 RepID=UPI000F799BFF|nr:hypothetical protein [Antribacter gilvus]